MRRDKRHPADIHQDGQRAHYALELLSPHFDKFRRAAIADLQSAQRGGKLDLATAQALTIRLNTLDDLERELTRTIASARQMQEKLHNDKGAKQS